MANPSDAGSNPAGPLIPQLLEALDTLSGLHPGSRPAHAKGAMFAGTFTPSPEAAGLTRAPHATRPSTPVVVRFSDSSGLPTVADNDPQRASPRGFAVRFYLADHVHTDIIGHSHDGFPVRTGAEFLEFLRAAAAAGGGHPEAMGAFLAAHPLRQGVRRGPEADPLELRPGVVLRRDGVPLHEWRRASRYGRFRIRPAAGADHLSAEGSASKPADFLFDELDGRLARGPIAFDVSVQMAGEGDDVDDASIPWPADRPEVPFGTITLTHRADDADPEMRKIIFDPVPRVDGIDPSADPIIAVRSELYLLSGRRRRAADRREQSGHAG